MKQAKCLVWVILAVGLIAFACFAQTNGTSPDGVINTVERPKNAGHIQGTNEAAIIDWEKVDKENEERLRHPHPSDLPFPNFETGPGRPLPIHVNFYGINDRYPAYLLCQYDVKEKDYNQTNEPEWFKASLRQIRHFGPKKFPPLKWVVVMIGNRAEWKDASTFEQSCKVAAIFKAGDVFNHWRRLSPLIAHADMDRHPFKYDRTQPTPGEQQRWIIVEQHTATNNPTTGSINTSASPPP